MHKVKKVDDDILSLDKSYSCVYADDKYQINDSVVADNFCKKISKSCGPGIQYNDTEDKALKLIEFTGWNIPK